MFLRACEVLKGGCSDIEMWGALVSLKELLEGKNRSLKKDEGLDFYRSQVLSIVEKLIYDRSVNYIENYKMCFYILKESLIEKYLAAFKSGLIKKDREKEALGNIKKCILLFLSEFTWQKDAEKRLAVYKIAIKTVADAIIKGKLNSIYTGNDDKRLDEVIQEFVDKVLLYISTPRAKLSPKYNKYIKKCIKYGKQCVTERFCITI